MRALATDLAHLLLSGPLWVVLGLAALAAWGFRSARGTGAHRLRWAFAGGAALAWVTSAPLAAVALTAWIESRHPVPRAGEAERRDDNVILVLTAGWLRSTATGYEQKLGEAGWERTAAAVDLWHRIGGRLLFSGAPHPDGRGSAAESMAALARSVGVPAQALLVEPRSLNTRENIAYSRQLLPPGHGPVWLVTSALHMPRSVATARAQGLAVIPYPCDFRADERVTDWRLWLPANEGWIALERALHEAVGLLAYRMRGWA